MTIDDKIRDEIWYDIDRQAGKVSSSDKIDKYEYLTSEEMTSLSK